MTKKSSYPYLMVFAAILMLLSIPKSSSEKLRGVAVATLAPVWEQLNQAKLGIIALGWGAERPESTLSYSDTNPPLTRSEELQHLQLKTMLLAQETDNLREILEHQLYLNTQKPLEKYQDAISARVIFRSPSSWNSSLWINLGAADNAFYNTPRIVKNSPVVVGTSLVGVIDYVGTHQSRVKLITDSGLTPSVRAARGIPQIQVLDEHTHYLLEGLSNLQKAPLEANDMLLLTALLEKMRRHLRENYPSTWQLAKGEIQGSSNPLWRTQRSLLKGIGFNYDFPDDAGPARDLRTGKSLDDSNSSAIEILKVNDILVTTGMDGVFPPGLHVATVTHIGQLREGDYTYELEAKPTAGNLDELSLVFIIPPLGYDYGDQPQPIGR